MKKHILIFWFVLFFATAARAQYDSSGIYLSVDDYRKGKLTLAVNCQATKKEKLKLNEGLGSKPYVSVRHAGRNDHFDKSKIFGYKDCKKGVSRFFKEEDYLILNTSEMVLYSRKKPISLGKGGFTVVTVYYFSATDVDPIFQLTRTNLAKVYSENRKFSSSLDYRFSSNKELIEFDTSNHIYKVAEVYKESREDIR
jgi:hypothetical protein